MELGPRPTIHFGTAQMGPPVMSLGLRAAGTAIGTPVGQLASTVAPSLLPPDLAALIEEVRLLRHVIEAQTETLQHLHTRLTQPPWWRTAWARFRRLLHRFHRT